MRIVINVWDEVKKDFFNIRDFETSRPQWGWRDFDDHDKYKIFNVTSFNWGVVQYNVEPKTEVSK